jgi:hypothetical protein
MNHAIPAATISALKEDLQLRRADPNNEAYQPPALSKKYGLGQSTIVRIYRHMLLATPVTEKKKAEVLKLFKEHRSIKRAAKLAGVAVEKVKKIISDSGLPIPEPMKNRGVGDISHFDWAAATLRMFQDGYVHCGLQYMQAHKITVAQLAAQQVKGYMR